MGRIFGDERMVRRAHALVKRSRLLVNAIHLPGITCTTRQPDIDWNIEQDLEVGREAVRRQRLRRVNRRPR
jgi:hypothetical protein